MDSTLLDCQDHRPLHAALIFGGEFLLASKGLGRGNHVQPFLRGPDDLRLGLLQLGSETSELSADDLQDQVEGRDQHRDDQGQPRIDAEHQDHRAHCRQEARRDVSDGPRDEIAKPRDLERQKRQQVALMAGLVESERQ